MKLLVTLVILSSTLALIIAQAGFMLVSLFFLLFSSILLLSIAEAGGSRAKTAVTFCLAMIGTFIFISYKGLPPAGSIEKGLETITHTIHFSIFVFLFGLYLFVNCVSYSGIIGEFSWKVVKMTKGNLSLIFVSVILLTALLSGIFDGATVASIMGIITLTILLSSSLKQKDIVSIMLLIVICTNVGGVWFVLGEPTNILAAEKMGLSPAFFLKYAVPFALISVIVCCFFAMKLGKGKPPINAKKPELEVLLEGISLKRIHSGKGNLLDTMKSLGNIELGQVRQIEKLMSKGIPDFEAALSAGVPQSIVYDALSLNLNSSQLAQGLIDYWLAVQDNNPIANIIIGDLLFFVSEEYRKRSASRFLVFTSIVVLIGLLGLHAIFPIIPTWISTIAGGFLAFIGVRNKAKINILKHTWHDLKEAFFLISLFALISIINTSGGFQIIGEKIIALGSPVLVGSVILLISSLLSAVADNIAVMDIITNLITGSTHWQFLSLSVIIGTALGGFCSPIASVQAIILCNLIRRITNIKFIEWVKQIFLIYLILLVLFIIVLVIIFNLNVMPVIPWAGR